MSENFDQIRSRSPFTSVDGSETIVLNQNGVTKGGFLSVLREYILAGFDPVPYVPPAQATDQELQLGAETDERMYSPRQIVETIAFHTAPKEPHFINEDSEITEADLNTILVCDAGHEITLSLTDLPAIENGYFRVVNLAESAVTVTKPTGVTFVDTTGVITDKAVMQHSMLEFLFIGDSTWYVRE